MKEETNRFPSAWPDTEKRKKCLGIFLSGFD